MYALPAKISLVQSRDPIEHSFNELGPFVPQSFASKSISEPTPQAVTIAKLQSTTTRLASNVASASVTFDSPPEVGNGIVVGLVTSGGDTWIGGCTDNQGNTYTVAKQQPPGIGTGIAAIFYCNKVANSASPFTITINSNPLTDLMMKAFEINGELSINRSQGGAVNGTTAFTPIMPGLTADSVFAASAISIWAAQTSITAVSSAPASPAWTEESEKLTGVVAGEIDTRILTGVLGLATEARWTLNPGGWCDYVVVAFNVLEKIPPTPGKSITNGFVRSTSAGNMIICKKRK